MYGKPKASLWRNLSTGTPQNLFSTILCFVALVYMSYFFQNRGVPNENIVQNHLNIPYLNVCRHIFIPLKFVIWFHSWKSSDPKIIGIKIYLFENFRQKKGSRKF